MVRLFVAKPEKTVACGGDELVLSAGVRAEPNRADT